MHSFYEIGKQPKGIISFCWDLSIFVKGGGLPGDGQKGDSGDLEEGDHGNQE